MQKQTLKSHINAALKASNDAHVSSELNKLLKYLSDQKPKQLVAKKQVVVKKQTKPNIRLPKVWIYNGNNWRPKDLAQELKKRKDECNAGDMFVPDNFAGENGGDIFFVSVDKKKLMPLIPIKDGEYAFPAWVLELGLENGHTMEQVLNVYTKVRGIMNILDFYVLPYKMQEEQFEKKDYVTPIKVHWFKTKKTEVIWDGHTLHEMFGDDYGPPASEVFLTFMKPPTQQCVAQTTKKYTSRPSPPFPASDCPGQAKTGNDGKAYMSTANVKGVYTWKLAK